MERSHLPCSLGKKMAKVVMMPKGAGVPITPSVERGGCRFQVQGRDVVFDCNGCPLAADVPSEGCLPSIRAALEAHQETMGIIFRGPEDVWVRSDGLEPLRSLMAAEKAREGLRKALRSLPCPRPISAERIERFLEKAVAGTSDQFCQGRGEECLTCIERQQEAIGSMRSMSGKARKALAADRFRITEVHGGGQ